MIGSEKRLLKKHVVLLGAGASVEAGLLPSTKLTEKIYTDFAHNQRHDQKFTRLLAYIISRLKLRNSRRGESPYDPIDVEELFDAMNGIIRRDAFVISEFVERWDAFLDDVGSGEEIKNLESILKNIVRSVVNDAAARGRGGFGSFDLSRNVRSLADLIRPNHKVHMDERQLRTFLQPFFSVLVQNLTIKDGSSDYLGPLVTSPDVSLVATLNYDLGVELCCQSFGRPYDYGLDRWALQKRVDWKQSDGVRLLKLHGSLNWVGTEEDIKVKDSEIRPSERRIMIFGGGGNKLSADGPFLQFLYRFERALFNSGSLLVVGYSFRDAHINAILQRWRLTRRITRLTVIDPSPPPLWRLGFHDGEVKRRVGNRETTLKMHLRTLPCGAAEGIRSFFQEEDLFAHAPAN